MNKNLIAPAAALALVLSLGTAVSANHHEKGHGHAAGMHDIVDTAMASPNHKTLVKAVKAAGLVNTLKGKGPFTVFGPTDEAFAKLPKGALENLLKPENKAKLVAVLTYHVVPAKVMAKDVFGMTQKGKVAHPKTVQGEMLDVKSNGKMVWVNNAMVVKADIACTNGVIHVIDKVLMPKK